MNLEKIIRECSAGFLDNILYLTKIEFNEDDYEEVVDLITKLIKAKQ